MAGGKESTLERVAALDGVRAVNVAAGSEHSALVTGKVLTQLFGVSLRSGNILCQVL